MKSRLRFALTVLVLAFGLLAGDPAQACRPYRIELYQDPGGVYCGNRTCSLSSETIGFATGEVTCYYDCPEITWYYCLWA